MGLIVRIYGIESVNDFTVSIKEDLSPYPLDSGYTQYGTIYSGGTTQIELYGTTFDFNENYWIKITDIVTNRFIIKNIKTNDVNAYSECF